MPKIKTRKSTAKRFKVKTKDNVKRGNQGTRHNTGKKNTDQNRKGRRDSVVSKSDLKRIKDIIGK